MAALAAGARIALAGMFLWSAVAKVRARRALPALLADFGLPRAVVRLMTFALPACEALIAVALLVFWESSVPAWIAVGVLALFTVQLVRAIPRHVPCPCFGTAAAAPASAASVVRNGVLLALAVIATGSPSGASAAGVAVATVVLAIVVAGAVLLSDGAARRAPTRPR